MYTDIICDFGCMCLTVDAQEVQTDSSPAMNSAYLKCHKYHIPFSSYTLFCLILKNSRPYNTLAMRIDVGWRTWRKYSHIIASEFSRVSFES